MGFFYNKYLQITEMMCGWLAFCLLLLSLIASVLCLTLVLLIDSRCPTSLVIICHRTEDDFNCV